MKPEVLLFDLDDTLILDKRAAEEAFLSTSELVKQKYGIPTEEFSDVVRTKARELWHQLPTYTYCRKIGISSREGLWGQFTGQNKNLRLLSRLVADYRLCSWENALQFFNISNPKLAHDLSGIFRTKRCNRHIPFNDTLPVLHELKAKFNLGLITNGAPDIQRTKIAGAGLENFFRYIGISGEVGVGKPDEKIFHITLKEFGVQPEKAIMIGDSLKTDVHGARMAGIRNIWINRDNKPLQDNIIPDHTISTLYELPDLLL